MEFVAVETAEEEPVRFAADGQALVRFLASQMRANRAAEFVRAAMGARIEPDATEHPQHFVEGQAPGHGCTTLAGS